MRHEGIASRAADSGGAVRSAIESLRLPDRYGPGNTCASGARGGRPWTKGALYKVLVNRVYLDEAVHKGVA